jgi:replicative DNA helicase
VALAQLNRSNESMGVRRPKMSDLRSSGQIEQDADVVILLHREDYYHRNEMEYQPNHCLEAIIAKVRDGPAGTVPLHFDEKTQRISDWVHEIPEYLRSSEN